MTRWVLISLLLLNFLPRLVLAERVLPHHFADSIEVKLILVDDAEKVGLLNDLAEYYVRNYPGKALENSKKALVLARRLNDKKNESRALRNVGISQQHLIAEYDSALFYCFEALKISEPNNLFIETIENHIAIAKVYNEVGNYSKSIDYLTRAELITSTITDYKDAVQIKILKSQSFLNIELYNESIEELKGALKICKLHDMLLEEAQVRMASADHYLSIVNEDLAYEHLKIALDIANKKGQVDDISNALNLLAHYHTTFNRPEMAIEPLQKSLELRQYLGDPKGIAECYFFIGFNYNKMGEFNTAITYLDESKKICEQINYKRVLRRCYNQLYNSYSNLDDFEKATENRDLYVSITELIFAEESERQIAEQQAKFDIEQKDKEIQLQQERLDLRSQQYEKQRKYNIALVSITLLLLTLGGLLYKNYRDKKKINIQLAQKNVTISNQNEKLQNLNNTKDKFFSIIGHDLKGPLNSLTSFLNLLKNHTSSLSEAEIKNLAVELDKSVDNLRSLLENLLTWARSQTGNIEIKPQTINIYPLVRENIELLRNQANEKGIELSYKGNGEIVARADQNSVSTVIRNLISNAIKFTHAHGKIDVVVEEWKDAIEVSVIDNGVGMTKDVINQLFTVGSKHTTLGTNKEKGTGLGLILCKEFIEKNGGKIMVASTPGSGSRFSFSLPKN